MTLGGAAYAHPMSERRITETDGFFLPTPTTVDAGTGRFNTSVGSSNARPTLAMMAKKSLWPTPQARDYRSGDKPDSPRAIRKRQQGWSPNLNDVVMWPTPRANAAMAATITPASAWNTKRFPNLETIVGRQMWPTPTAHNAKETNAPSESERNTPTLAAQAGGKLNPEWVEWLMGFPIGFTDSKDWETRKSRFKRQQPINSSGESDAP